MAVRTEEWYEIVFQNYWIVGETILFVPSPWKGFIKNTYRAFWWLFTDLLFTWSSINSKNYSVYKYKLQQYWTHYSVCKQMVEEKLYIDLWSCCKIKIVKTSNLWIYHSRYHSLFALKKIVVVEFRTVCVDGFHVIPIHRNNKNGRAMVRSSKRIE